MRFLECPHLPGSRVTLCAVGGENPEIVSALRELNIEVIELGANPMLPEPLRTHADMLLHDRGGGSLFLAAGTGAKSRLEEYGFLAAEVPVGGGYPEHVALNCFCLHNRLFGRLDAVPYQLLNYYQSIGAGTVEVKQGYTKCSTAIVDHSSIITDRKSVV